MITKDERGRFAPGNGGGPGRPPVATERTYLHSLQTACPPERWERIVSRAVDDAEAGDAKARDFLARYLIGTPERTPSTLLSIAVDDAAGIDEVTRRADARAMADAHARRGQELDALILAR